jgi:hypothetical protein
MENKLNEPLISARTKAEHNLDKQLTSEVRQTIDTHVEELVCILDFPSFNETPRQIHP